MKKVLSFTTHARPREDVVAELGHGARFLGLDIKIKKARGYSEADEFEVTVKGPETLVNGYASCVKDWVAIQERKATTKAKS